MRLINTRTLVLEEFLDGDVPRYAILSHTWGDDEVSYQDICGVTARARDKSGYVKIEQACSLAQRDDYDYIWIDTCCIDKSSSAELQEAINSMYRWYANAEVCYAYLSDVTSSPSQGLLGPVDNKHIQKMDAIDLARSDPFPAMFRNSKWFTRGWTLQELIAPSAVTFLNSTWSVVGTKMSLMKIVVKATGIERPVLAKKVAVSTISVAKRMSWAAKRKTTRVEDRAYSLLGIFDINMPMLYGEGGKAFARLQEEIMKGSTDLSILAWEPTDGVPRGTLLAESPANFADSDKVVLWGPPRVYEMTNRGLRIDADMLKKPRHETINLFGGQTSNEVHVVLNCRFEDRFDGALALKLRRYAQTDDYHPISGNDGNEQRSRLVLLERSRVEQAERQSLLITRDFELETRNVQIQVQLEHVNGSSVRMRRESLVNYVRDDDAHPEDFWDLSSGFVRIKKESCARAGLVLMGMEEATFTVVFGFDHVRKLGDHCLFPGIWVEPQAVQGSLQNHCERQVSCQHKFSCRNGCSSMPTLAIATYEPTMETLTASITVDSLMGETILKVSLRLNIGPWVGDRQSSNQYMRNLERGRVMHELDAVDAVRSGGGGDELLRPAIELDEVDPGMSNQAESVPQTSEQAPDAAQTRSTSSVPAELDAVHTGRAVIPDSSAGDLETAQKHFTMPMTVRAIHNVAGSRLKELEQLFYISWTAPEESDMPRITDTVPRDGWSRLRPFHTNQFIPEGFCLKTKKPAISGAVVFRSHGSPGCVLVFTGSTDPTAQWGILAFEEENETPLPEVVRAVDTTLVQNRFGKVEPQDQSDALYKAAQAIATMPNRSLQVSMKRTAVRPVTYEIDIVELPPSFSGAPYDDEVPVTSASGFIWR